MGIADSDREEGRDIEFAGTAARRTLEKKLLWKIDRRMSILVLTYILNYVSRIHFDEDGFFSHSSRSTATTPGVYALAGKCVFGSC